MTSVTKKLMLTTYKPRKRMCFTNNTLKHYINLTEVLMCGRQISCIPPRLFDNCLFLVKIDISYNCLTELSRTTFVNCVNLEHLDISGNQLSTLSLDLSRTKIKTFQSTAMNYLCIFYSDMISKLNLTTLELIDMYCHATYSFNISTLKKLTLNNMHLRTSIPGSFRCIQLTELDLQNNALTALDTSELINLTSLNVSWNPINLDGLNFSNNGMLIHLSLYNTHVKILPKSLFEHIQRLLYLDAHGNGITNTTAVPDTVSLVIV